MSRFEELAPEHIVLHADADVENEDLRHGEDDEDVSEDDGDAEEEEEERPVVLLLQGVVVVDVGGGEVVIVEGECGEVDQTSSIHISNCHTTISLV